MCGLFTLVLRDHLIHKWANLPPQPLAKSSGLFVDFGFKSCVVLNVCTVHISTAHLRSCPHFCGTAALRGRGCCFYHAVSAASVSGKRLFDAPAVEGLEDIFFLVPSHSRTLLQHLSSAHANGLSATSPCHHPETSLNNKCQRSSFVWILIVNSKRKVTPPPLFLPLMFRSSGEEPGASVEVIRHHVTFAEWTQRDLSTGCRSQCCRRHFYDAAST